MDARLFAAATQRNRKPILDVLRRVLPASGAVLEIASYREWSANERAMRLGEPLPPTRMAVVLTVGIVIVAIVATVVAIVG